MGVLCYLCMAIDTKCAESYGGRTVLISGHPSQNEAGLELWSGPSCGPLRIAEGVLRIGKVAVIELSRLDVLLVAENPEPTDKDTVQPLLLRPETSLLARSALRFPHLMPLPCVWPA